MTPAFRLAVYYALAQDFMNSYGDDRFVTSQEISDLTGIHATVVRRDLMRVTQGKRGTGYPVWRLRADALRAITGKKRQIRQEANTVSALAAEVLLYL